MLRHSLTSLDVGSWDVSSSVLVKNIFFLTGLLSEITLGIVFHITDDPAFGNAGSYVRTKWMQVNLGKGGTHEHPKGKVFESPRDLLVFHHDRTKRETDIEHYIRVDSAQLAVTFDKGAHDVTGAMTSRVHSARETKTLAKNAYKRASYTFNDAVHTWSHRGEKLGKDEIKAVAQRDSKLVPTAFVVELVDRTHVIMFEVKHGQDAEVPTGVFACCQGYKFTDGWTTNKDGTGAPYETGGKIKSVFSR
ncbi:unnamed protein product [Cylicostephanus goldi]|uniref:Uncharacterized protein n=1 Tax=Cylicostephanus goldi TaxID=71465 RepID=A0A3P6RA42_CYLGO|nr:unnamed protein product [Cylicostephanus goldi]